MASAVTAKLFKNGRSQAVRLPKEFRFTGDEVLVRREGEAVILEPVKRKRGRVAIGNDCARCTMRPISSLEHHTTGPSMWTRRELPFRHQRLHPPDEAA